MFFSYPDRSDVVGMKQVWQRAEMLAWRDSELYLEAARSRTRVATSDRLKMKTRGKAYRRRALRITNRLNARH